MPVPYVLPLLPPPQILVDVGDREVPAEPTRVWGPLAITEVPTIVDGVRVFRGDTSIRAVGGRVAQVVVRTPRVPTVGTFPTHVGETLPGVILEEERVWFPTGDGLVAARWVTTDTGHELVVDGDGRVRFRAGPPHGAGTVAALHHPRRPDDPLVASPLVGVTLRGAAGDTVTDDAGAWSLSDAAPTVSLEGPWFTVDDQGGAALSAVVGDGDVVLDHPDDLSELDAWVAATTVRAAWLPYGPGHEWLEGNVTLEVDQALASCNAYYWAWTLHFYRPVRSCFPPAQHADVVWHEWGHGLHDHSRAGPFDLALSEGAADVVAWRLSGDDVIARGLFKDGTGFRDLSEVRRFPDDADDYDAHETGRIVSGALRALSLDWADEPAGTFERWFLAWLAVGPAMESAYDDALVADDDDGDLQNGTPHECDLAVAFGPHGYGPLQDGFGRVTAQHEPPRALVADGPTPVVVEWETDLDRCFDVEPGDVALVVTVDGGDEQRADLVGEGARAEGSLPSAPPGAVVRWRFEGEVHGEVVDLPGRGGWYELTAAGEGPPPDEDPDPTASPTTPTTTPAADDQAGAEPAGCGCASSAPAPWGFGALAALALRRRTSAR